MCFLIKLNRTHLSLCASLAQKREDCISCFLCMPYICVFISVFVYEVICVCVCLSVCVCVCVSAL